MEITTYNKRIFTFASFKNAVKDIVAHMGDLRAAARSGRISRPFAEKIMLVVTQVNGCRYCNYGHTRMALAAGVPEAELQKLLALELAEFPETEVVALTFAQHYAESACRPEPAAWQRLVDYYGPQAAVDILAYLRMITFGNLYGNTLDAFLSRLGGQPAAGSSLGSELGVLVGSLVVLPAGLLSKILNRLFTRSKRAVITSSNLEKTENPTP